jgi:TNF receptor-associated protein 1
VTKKLLRFLRDKAKENAAAYNLFWDRHAQFIKEGVCTDFANQPDLAKLLRFDTSLLKPTDAPVSIDEVASRCTAGQKKLYYLSAPNRAMAELSPYYEVFKRAGVEVMFLYHTLDDFCMANLRTYEGRELVAAESGEIEAGLLGDKPAGKEGEENALGDAELCAWLKLVLGDLVSQVQVTDRLKDSPALIVDHESASLRRMMKLVDQHEKGAKALDSRGLGKQRMEVNPRHPIIAGLNRTRAQDPALAALLARNVFDGALVAAGLVDDPREMIPRWNGLVEQLLQKAQSNKPAAA